MKKIGLFLGALLIIGLFVVVPGMIQTSGQEEEDLSATANPVFKEIQSHINRMDEKSWNKAIYDTISIKIDEKRYADLIDDTQYELLTHNLNVSYIPKLVRATKAFFKGACDDRGRLQRLNSELRRYRDRMVDKKYVRSVNEMRDATSSVYAATSYTYEGRRNGLEYEITTYIRKASFKLDMQNQFNDKLSDYISRPYLKNCKIVKKSITKSRKNLNQFHVKYLEEKIDHYLKNENYELQKQRALKKEIARYQEIDYLNDTSQTGPFAEQLLEKLDAKLEQINDLEN